MLYDDLRAKLLTSDRRLARLLGAVPRVSTRTPADVLAVLEDAVNAARDDRAACPQAKARTLATLSAAILKAIELTEMEGRLTEIEARLNRGGTR
jgi:hypothetical protein